MRQSAQAIRRTILAACVGGVVALGFIPTAAGAPSPSWIARADAAKQACSSGEVAKGARLLAKLYATTHDPIWIYNQGRCFQRNGKPVQALARFREYLRKTKKAPKDSEAASGVAEAEGHVKELEAQIAAHKTTVAPSEPTPPAAVAAEPAPSEPPAPLPAPLQAPAAPAVTTATAAPPPSPQGSSQGLLVAGVGLEILGAATLITGGIFSYLVDKTNSDARNLTAAGNVALGSDLRVKQEQGNRYTKSQWIFYGIGGAALATGLTLHIIGTRKPSGGPKAELQPAISPSACGLNLSVRL